MSGRTNGGAGPNPYDKRTRKTGRPPKITQGHIEEAVRLIGEGAMLGMVPGLMKISPATFNVWTRRGGKEADRRQKADEKWATMSADERKESRAIAKREAIYYDFLEAVNKARDERESALLGIIRKAAFGAPKIVRKTKKELLTTASGTPDDPIISRELIVTEVTETTSVEYDWRAAQYLAEKGNPSILGPRATLDIKAALPTDPASLANMELPELLALAESLQNALDGTAASE